MGEQTYGAAEAVRAEETYELRHRVLGRGETPADVAVEDDLDPDSGHVAVRDRTRIVATGTIRTRATPEGVEPAWQIRGMAVESKERNRGLGSAVLAALLAHADSRGGGVVWCHARIGARSLYERHGFTATGEPFDDPVAGRQIRMSRLSNEPSGSTGAARYLPRWELDGVAGTVVAIDVLRAFTTAAFAFDAGATRIWLAGTVEEALALRRSRPGSFVMGEEHGRRPDGFDLSNSPVAVVAADLDGRELVQRTSAGVQGVLAATHADRLFAASLVVASATARAIEATGLGAPSYVITGRFPDAIHHGEDDRLTAELIERVRTGQPTDAARTAAAIVDSPEAARTLAVGEGHVDPDDITFAVDVDRFDFALEVDRSDATPFLRRVGV